MSEQHMTPDQEREHSHNVTLQQLVLYLNGSNATLRTTPERREEHRAEMARRCLPHFTHAEQKHILSLTQIELEHLPCIHCRERSVGCTECGAVKDDAECRRS